MQENKTSLHMWKALLKERYPKGYALEIVKLARKRGYKVSISSVYNFFYKGSGTHKNIIEYCCLELMLR